MKKNKIKFRLPFLIFYLITKGLYDKRTIGNNQSKMVIFIVSNLGEFRKKILINRHKTA